MVGASSILMSLPMLPSNGPVSSDDEILVAPRRAILKHPMIAIALIGERNIIVTSR
jgi:hypothetical protein